MWRIDLLADYFLQRSSEVERTLSGQGVKSIIEAANQQSDRPFMLLAYDRMPLSILRGMKLPDYP